ncbi:MAG: 2-oxo acid dehydrogenase subunit E2 [Bacteroidetes bacterium]|nr:2-oxo acid dehydrogenase subunit E2 [Bacteroidota bacterium]MDA0937310.1 2-oxo acid dehydrogenase subunit E2 [Bacteroidota bacterium]MDA1344822.1 2-oxo acid dehydrogenase subunit E2 [Bacteroidota bacterium]
MAEIINMPRLSDTMEEGTVAKWFKKVGDTVKEGDILAEIETDKATMEFEAFHEGQLLHIGIEEGGTAPVDTLLAIIGQKGEDISGLVNQNDAPASASKPAAAPEVATQAPSTAEMPEGVVVITMPRLSDTMEEGTVAQWLKKVGDTVEEGEILAEIETDKATMEFEAFHAGTLLHIGIQQGETAAVDSVLALIGPKGVDVQAALAAVPAANTQQAALPTSEKIQATQAVATPEPPVKKEAATPKATPVVASNGRVVASPLAKKIAEEKGINLASVAGSGDHGRIIKRDVENFTASGTAAYAAPVGVEKITELANSQMRKTIAKRLAASKFSAPHYYLGVEFDMDHAIAFRAQYNTLPDTKISFNDIVIKAVAMALRQHPEVNSQWFDDKIVHNHHMHIGVAVAVTDGLVVPVVKFADTLPLPQIGSSVKDFAQRARDKKLTPAEMEGSTFTVSNLGMFGIQEFTSIINQPNSAILSVGSIEEKPVVKEGKIVVGHTMKLTLACDHRTVDGATGAQFLQTLRGYIENPVTLLV